WSGEPGLRGPPGLEDPAQLTRSAREWLARLGEAQAVQFDGDLAAARKALDGVGLDPDARYVLELFHEVLGHVAALAANHLGLLGQGLGRAFDHAKAQAGLRVEAIAVFFTAEEGDALADQFLRRHGVSPCTSTMRRPMPSATSGGTPTRLAQRHSRMVLAREP